MAHEYGHGLGLNRHEKYGSKIEGQPGIMSTIQNLVNAPYTKDPTQGDSKGVYDSKGNLTSVINPLNQDARKVIKSDLKKLNFHNGRIGNVSNAFLDSKGNIQPK